MPAKKKPAGAESEQILARIDAIESGVASALAKLDIASAKTAKRLDGVEEYCRILNQQTVGLGEQLNEIEEKLDAPPQEKRRLKWFGW